MGDAPDILPYILQAAWDAEDKNAPYEDKKIKFPIREDKQRKDRKSGAFTSEKVDAWSTWDFDDANHSKCKKYHDFQESMKEYIEINHRFPLQWEGPAWIEIAKQKNEPNKAK